MEMDFFPFEKSMTCLELVDALNDGIIRCIQTSGRTLPSSLVPSTIQCQWTEYATVADNNGSILCSPVVEDLKRFLHSSNGTVGSDGRPLLYAACLGLLLSTRDSRSNEEGAKVITPLSTFLSIATYLLDEMNVDPNEPTQTKGACHRPPLHLLARSCHSTAVRFLLSRGADPSQRDDEGWTALMACCLPDILSADKGGPTDQERVETAKILMSNEIVVDVDAQNYCGYTALHYSCEGLNSALIGCLLKEGRADPTLRTIWGQSVVGITRSHSGRDSDKAATCEAILLSHLQAAIIDTDPIHSFLEEERKVFDLMNLMETVLIPASRCKDSNSHAENDIGRLMAQDRRIVTALMNHVNLNPAILFERKAFQQHPQHDMNLYEVIYHRIIDLMPLAFLRVYCNRNPTNEEREIVTCLNYDLRKISEKSREGIRYIDSTSVMSQSFCLHRERGHVARQVELLNDLIVAPLQRTVAFGIPSNIVLRKIIEYAPRIIEVGAGTGFWSCLLSNLGADVLAYDANPPGYIDDTTSDGGQNVYFGSTSYYPVERGVTSTIFGGPCSSFADRALLIVWPNNPDATDNPHVVVNGSSLPPVWDFDCLQKYYEAGGKTVIYAGEREANVQTSSNATLPDCGFCASRKFQLFLQTHFHLKAELKIPKWWMKEDDVTVWERNSDSAAL
eukprot:CCRYP_014509-RA/>CCRYP_014509-RA protein AED:0.29 eAED:0.29 QI:0/-1/0/1/-1/1/1/0/675